MKKSISIILAIALLFFAFPAANVHGETGSSMSMLHTSGSRIVDEAGKQITLRGTNLGGWLMQEGWMTPLGSGEIDHSFIVNITASATNGDHVASNAIDTVTTDEITTNNMFTYWQSTSAQAENSAELLIELDKIRYFDRIVVETGPAHTGDYLRGAVVWMSNNWTDWFSADTITVDESKSNEGIVTILTGDQSAKYIAIRPGRASEDGQYWTVANISLCMTDEYTVRNHLIRRFGETRTNQMIATFQNNYITETDIQNIANMNMNFVRVPVYWMDFMLKDGTMRTDPYNGFAKLDWLLNVC
ncbi:discoidin domain-containing protein [Lachnoclostridium sp. Marseille-P6806]|uniref:discoidin domain-containing protein n=1 Tax=Lachnoclostridium sp. Marseille-P6806 TaxID=2364793 RepID=UPI0013EF55D4|nr:discoidin domain-containing protein [Lachnoclostridium sp. Marseille-P6806]